jgi:hypothetical protein
MSFAAGVRDLKGGALSMLETHIVMSSLIFRLILILVLRLALLHVLFLSSLMNLTIIHMVLVHERTALNLDTLVMAHVLIMDHFLCRHGFPAGGFHTRFEPRHLDSPHFPRRGSHPTRSSGEVQKIVKTSSGRMVK